jgi:hypothetical protein
VQSPIALDYRSLGVQTDLLIYSKSDMTAWYAFGGTFWGEGTLDWAANMFGNISVLVAAFVAFFGVCSARAQTPAASSLFSVDGFAHTKNIVANRASNIRRSRGVTDLSPNTHHAERSSRRIRSCILRGQRSLHKYLEPAFWDPNEVGSDIAKLTKKFNKQPNIVRMPRVPGEADGVIAIWGDVQLERLNKASMDILSTGQNPSRGILVDFIGNFERSAKKGLPVYRLTGGPGYVWAASFNKEGRGTLRFFAIDPATLLGPIASKSAPPPSSNSQQSSSNDLQANQLYAKIGWWSITHREVWELKRL